MTTPDVPRRDRRRALGALAFALLPCALRAEPDEQALGRDAGYPVGDARDWYAERHRVGSWSAMDRVAGQPVRGVPTGGTPLALAAARGAPDIRYRFGGMTRSVDDYLDRQRITGLLVLQGDRIVVERYRYGRTPDARFLSFSMAKSVVSLLAGIAQAKGTIRSFDDAAERYVPELAGSAYGSTALRHLLQMGSGLAFSERYDGHDDIARLVRAFATGTPSVIDVLRSVQDRQAPAGTRFAYASAETAVLGRVVAGATGRHLSELTSQWLWQPLGAERDAFWLVGADGHEQAFSGFNATLRDWARIGCLLALDGAIDSRAIVPREYLLDATDATRQPPGFRPREATPIYGYGRQFWIQPLRERTFALFGVHGQATFVQPASGVVMVQTAVYAAPAGTGDPAPVQERGAFWNGVLASLGGSTTPL
ncbi:MAG TPA: serine hydrolase [Caldimonas sp.]|nr:serine hydrolase [Caldimonas sp.]